MGSILGDLGIRAPIADEHFMETVYLPDGDGHMVYNIYAAGEWRGQPEVPPGTGSGWFALHELESIEMDELVRDALLVSFGLREPRDRTAEVIAALTGTGFEAEAGGPPASPLGRHEKEAAATGLATAALELAGDVAGFALGEVWAHPALDPRTRSLQVVAMLAALGRTGPLAPSIDGALDHGATPEQVIQTLRTVAVYAGFPAALEAWPVMEKVFERRGIARPGREP
jgi:4-carboxymuconolactone decarboxylase